ncbi:glutamate receptor ionotropic, delta-2-like [Glandiceps talaboti]
MDIYVLVFLVCSMCTCGLGEISTDFDVIRLGVIVEGGSKMEENVVNLALDHINEDEDLLSNRRLEYIIRRTPADNAFAAIQAACSLLESRVSAVVTSLTCDVNKAIQSMLDVHHIPHIGVLHNRCRERAPPYDGYTFSIRPNMTQSNIATLDLITLMRWNKTVVFYDDSEDQIQIREMLQIASEHYRGSRVIMIKCDSTMNTRQQLATLKERNMKHFAVYCNMQNTVHILTQASSFGMTIGEYQWLIVAQVMSDIELRQLNGIVGIVTVLRQSIPTHTYNTKFAEAWARIRLGYHPNSTNAALSPIKTAQVIHAYLYDAILTMATAIDDVIIRGKWVGPTNLSCDGAVGKDGQNSLRGSQKFKKTMRKIRLEGLLGDISFRQGSYNDHINMEIMSVENLMNVSQLWRIGSWDTLGKLRLIQTPFTRNFDSYKINHTLRIVTILESPFMMRQDTETGPKYTGYCMDLIMQIADTLKVKYELYEVPDNKYGSQNDDGTWNGLVGEVYYGRAHLAVAGMIITSSRGTVVDFTKPFMNYGASILIRKPQQTTNTFAFLRPLRISVWGCIAASILFTGIVLCVLDRLSPFSSYNLKKNKPSRETVRFTLMNSIWFTFSGLMQQGADDTPRSMSGRMMGAFWWFCSLIVVATYTANLAAFLTVSRMDTSINSLEDLALQSKVVYGTIEGSSLMRWFERRADQDELYSRLWSFMSTVKPSAWVPTADDGYQRVVDEDYAFFWDSPILEYVKQQNCDVMTVGKPFNLKGYGIATPRGAPYREDISVLFLKMQEKGRLEELRRTWFEKESICSSNAARGQPTDVQLETIAGVFYVLVMGVALAFLSLLLEKVYCIYGEYRKYLEARNTRKYQVSKRNSVSTSVSSQHDDNMIIQSWTNQETIAAL